MLTWLVSVFVAMLALSLVSQLVDEAGPPIVLDPEHKLEIPPPPQSMYKLGKEAIGQTLSKDQPPIQTPTQEQDSDLTPSSNKHQHTSSDTETPHVPREH